MIPHGYWPGKSANTPLRFRGLAALGTLVLLIVFACNVPADETTRERRYQQFQQKRISILEAMQADLTSVKRWCDERSLTAGTARVTALSESLADRQSQPELPRLAQPVLSNQLVSEDQLWQIQLRHHRSERAKEMYSAARSALRAGLPSLAFAMIGDVVRLDPDHKLARSVLGYDLFFDPSQKENPQYAGEWVSPFEATMRSGSSPHVYDSRFGWIPAANLSRYEQGQRQWKNGWISDVKESELRRDFQNAWEIRSEHFLVKTNVSQQAGVQLSENLEIFYAWLQQNMASFFDTPESMRDRFDEADRRRGSRKLAAPMEVLYFATREEYNRRVQDKVPATVETNGLYWQPDRRCYFFAKPDQEDLTTLFHEATHQILDLHTADERVVAQRARARRLKQRSASDWILCEHSNFWMIEGLACYCESFEIIDGEVRVGRPDFVRFDTARQRLLDPELFFYVPQRQFFGLGKSAFQSHPNVSQFYTQASGTVHFMMHYQDGLYRDDFFALLSAAYRPDPNDLLTEPSFEKISGVPFEEIDRQYRLHMQQLEDQLLGAGR